jgi:capsular exopolysaccharide synthesis family protein
LDDDIDLRAIFGTIRRRIWLILSVTALCVGLSGLVLVALKPVYSATALIMIDPSTKDLLNPNVQGGGGQSDSARVDSEALLVASDTTLLQVTKALDLVDDPEFGVKLGMMDSLRILLKLRDPTPPTGDEALKSVMIGLRNAVSVDRRGLTFLIAVTAHSRRPDMAATLANAIADTYISEQLNSKVSTTLASRDVIQARIADAAGTVAKSEGAFDDFIDANLAQISAETGRADLTTLRQQITDLSDAATSSKSIVSAAQAELTRQDWSALAQTLKDDALAALERRRSDLAENLAATPTQSPTVADLKSQLATLEGQIKQAANARLANLQQAVTSDQQQVTQLRASLRNDVLGSDLSPDTLTRLYELQKSSEIARNQYQTLLSRQADLDTQAFLQVADSRVASPAVSPIQPSFPNPLTVLGLGAGLGLALGFGLAAVMENFVGGITSEGQAVALLRVPVIASLGRQNLRTGLLGRRMASVADVLLERPLSPFADTIRRVMVKIDQALNASGRDPAEYQRAPVVMVTSSAAREGKTSVALSLARACALAGQSTLLIDCDLRNPSIHSNIDAPQGVGLMEYLTAGDAPIDLDRMIIVDRGSGARLMINGVRSSIPTEQLIASRAFTDLIEAARRNFEVVILDTAPIGPVVDSLRIATLADVVLFVVKWAGVPQQQVRSSMSELETAMRPGAARHVLLNMTHGGRGYGSDRYASYSGPAELT